MKTSSILDNDEQVQQNMDSRLLERVFNIASKTIGFDLLTKTDSK